jgi:NADH-quinone oxidoreductase subunit L
MTTGTWGWLILAFPLAGTIIIALGWRGWAGRSAGWLGSLAIALAFASSIGAFVSLMAKDPDQRSVVSNAFDYIDIAGVHVSLGVLVDPLSVFMCLVVSGVSMLIHIYSVAYMDSDRGYVRFFSYLTSSSSRCCCWCWRRTSSY